VKEFVTDANVENLDSVLAFVTGELERADCPMKLMHQITLAVEELFVNIARHAYAPETGSAVIRAAAVGDEVIIELEDNGTPCNLLEKPEPDITASAQERELGGLGIFMVKKIMDSVAYAYKDGSNIVTMTKKIQGY